VRASESYSGQSKKRQAVVVERTTIFHLLTPSPTQVIEDGSVRTVHVIASGEVRIVVDARTKNHGVQNSSVEL